MEKMSDVGEGGGSRTRSKPPKMTMEVYLDFIHSNKKLDLVYGHLNQIIGMHGFKKIHKKHKGLLVEGVNSMELIDPARSTVNVDGVSGDAFLSIEEVIKDLSELEWHECCVTSLQTLNADDSASSSTVSNSSAEQPRRKQRRRLRKLRDIINDSGGSGGELVSKRRSCSPPSSSLVTKWVTMKNRSVRGIKAGKNGWGGGGKLDNTGLVTKAEVEW